jgi:hypothetical protein
MNEGELHAQFHELGFEIPHSSVKRWSRQNLLPRPDVATSRGTGGGRGRSADWPDATVEQAAAIYALRNQDYPGRKKRISPKTIIAIRVFANTFFVWLEEYRHNTDDPLLGDFRNRFFSDVDVPSKFVRETDRRNDKAKASGSRLAFYDGAREALAVKWITAVEKVSLGVPLTTSVTIRYYFARLLPKTQDPVASTRIPLCYLMSTAAKSRSDRIEINALSYSELKGLAKLVIEDEAFLGVKLDAEGWIGVKDEQDWSDLEDQVTTSILSFSERALAGGMA